MDVSLGQLRRENIGVRGYIVVYGTNLFICLLFTTMEKYKILIYV
jgi:hypothetical protein